MEIWNEICFYINKHKNSSEKEFQSNVEFIFDKLGWSSYKGEMISQKTIPIGSAQRLIPDIILKDNDKEVIVIELKKNNVSISNRIEQQLFSYMLQLKLKFGIFIGENLQFYYDDPNNNKPIKIFEIEFIENNEKAVDFISLIRKPFDEGKLLDFCAKKILEIGEDKKLADLENDILNGVFDNNIKIFFIELLQNKYEKHIIDKISNNLEVKVLLKNQTDITDTQPNPPIRHIIEKIDKNEAMNLVNREVNMGLNNSNTVFSNVNKGKPVWWFEPENSRFNYDFHLILNDAKKKILYYFFIPKNDITNPKATFYQRKDFDDKSQIEIYDDDPKFMDTKKTGNGLQFKKYLKREIQYSINS